jgi:hypothetical protein
MIEVTADSVVLPFTCMACEAFTANTSEAQACENVVNPEVSRFDRGEDTVYPFVDEPDMDVEDVNAATVAKFYEDMKPAGGGARQKEPSEEFSSVENTTALIADLEEQLTAAKHKVGFFENTLVPSLRKTVDILDAHIRVLEGQLETVTSNLDDELRIAAYETKAKAGYRHLLEEALKALASEKVKVANVEMLEDSARRAYIFAQIHAAEYQVEAEMEVQGRKYAEDQLRIANNRIASESTRELALFKRFDNLWNRAEDAENHPWRNLWTYATNSFQW